MSDQQNGTSNPKSEHHLKSYLYKIDVRSDNPFVLFKEWQTEVKGSGVPLPDIFNCATSDGCGRVSARSLLLRQLDEDGFVFMTDGRSKKSFDLARCSHAALTFLWVTPNTLKTRQVRIEGEVKRMNFEDYKHIYTREPIHCKIRGMICRQGEYVEWCDLKQHHDRMYQESQGQSEAPILDQPPPHYVVYKLYPEMMDFYAAEQCSIGDRVVFRLSQDWQLIPAYVRQQAPEYINRKDEGLESTFNNALRIRVGAVNNSAFSPNSPKWMYYHVAA